ncbi:MAG: hypothetical protein CK424_02900 [Legionella sp.]|nr:MAG: hypothetical protein CK424_02900 [Legionella sp.]
MENTTKALSSSTSRIQAALLGTNAVLEEEGMIENPEVVGMHIGGMVDIGQLPSSITVNVFNDAVTGTINNPTIIGVNIEQHMPAPCIPIPKQTLPNELDYYVPTFFEEMMKTQLDAQTKKVKKLVLHGITGSGKTVLAQKYYRDHHQNYIVHQVLYAETSFQWQQCLRDFAERLKPGLNQAIMIESEEVQFKRIKEVIQEKINEASWCILIDNWDSNKKGPIWSEINTIFNRGKGVLLVTTQHPSPLQDECSIDLNRVSSKKEDIDLFTEESCRLLDIILGSFKEFVGSKETKLHLAETLGYLPLSLAQAGHYMLWENKTRKEQGDCPFTYAAYQVVLAQELEKLIEAHQHLLQDKDGVPYDENSTVPEFRQLKIQEASVKLSVNKAIGVGEESDTILQAVLCCCGFLASRNIPQYFLKDFVQTILDKEKQSKADLEYQRVMTASSRYALLHYESTRSRIDNLYGLHMHRVVQKVLRESINALSILTTLNLRLLANYGEDKVRNEDILRIRELLPHLVSVLEHDERQMQNQPEIWRECYLIANHRLADSYFVFGQPIRQIALLERALIIKEKHYGSEHAEVAITLSNLATAYGNLGNAQQAKTLLERALPILTRHYGPEHSEVGLALMCLGVALGALGDVRQKKALLEQALPLIEKNYGPSHFQVARVLINLGNVFCELGVTKDAMACLERALLIQEKLFGPEYFELGITLTNLSVVYGELGNIQHQKNLLKRALVITKKHFGPEHIEVMIIFVNLADAYGSLGNVEKKISLLERVLIIQEQYYGLKHVKVAITLASLGTAYGNLGNAQQAKTQLERALTIQEQYYGQDHIEVGKTLTSLGAAYRDLDDVQQAKIFLYRALTIKKRHYGPEHIKVAETKLYIALSLHKENRNAKAYLLITECEKNFSIQPGGEKYLPHCLKIKQSIKNVIHNQILFLEESQTFMQKPASFFYHPHCMIDGRIVLGCDAPPGSIIDKNNCIIIPK